MDYNSLTLTETLLVIEQIRLENGLLMDTLYDPDIRAMFISNNTELKQLTEHLSKLKNARSSSCYSCSSL